LHQQLHGRLQVVKLPLFADIAALMGSLKELMLKVDIAALMGSLKELMLKVVTIVAAWHSG